MLTRLIILMAFSSFIVFGLSDSEASPNSSIKEISPHVVNLDLVQDSYDWRNTSYYYENHNSYNPSNHTWTHNYSESGDYWVMPNPTWNLSISNDRDSEQKQIWGPAISCDGTNDSSDEFCMYNGGGTGSLVTENYDISELSTRTTLFLRHRYNWDYYSD